MDEKLVQNQKAWNGAAKYFQGQGVLPVWGAVGEGADMPELIGEIEGKTFLEIGCGSGHSIEYLIQKGAGKVYGLDLSPEQIAFSQDRNKQAISNGNVELICSPMEEIVPVPKESIDTIFSIYGIGWTLDLPKTLQNIYSYLKPGGKLIFSFENHTFARTKFNKETSQITMVGSPYEDYDKKTRVDFFGSGAHIIYRLPSTWIREALGAGFELIQYFDPKPTIEDSPDSIFGDYYCKEKVNVAAPIFIMEFKKK